MNEDAEPVLVDCEYCQGKHEKGQVAYCPLNPNKPAPYGIHSCPHEQFTSCVSVNRLEDVGRFAADVTIQCVQCGARFQFLGLPGGLSLERPTVSVDGLEARMPIAPETTGECTDCGGPCRWEYADRHE